MADHFVKIRGTGSVTYDDAETRRTANCNRNALFVDFPMGKRRDNGELPLKNYDFALKNDRLFCNSRYAAVLRAGAGGVGM